MDRRAALRTIALASGAVLSPSAVLGVLQACSKQNNLHWKPTFFSPGEALIVSDVANVILPAGDTPGAVDVAVPQAVELLVRDMFDLEHGQRFKQGVRALADHFEAAAGYRYQAADPKVKTGFIEALYRLSGQEKKAVFELLSRDRVADEKQQRRQLLYNFLVTLRSFTLITYLTAEEVGESVFNYEPVAGQFEACIPLEEAGGTWALADYQLNR